MSITKGRRYKRKIMLIQNMHIIWRFKAMPTANSITTKPPCCCCCMHCRGDINKTTNTNYYV